MDYRVFRLGDWFIAKSNGVEYLVVSIKGGGEAIVGLNADGSRIVFSPSGIRRSKSVPAVLVDYSGGNYLVTKKGSIIDLSTRDFARGLTEASRNGLRVKAHNVRSVS